jgi:hypothetical protein
MWYTGEDLASFARNMLMDVARSFVIIPEAKKDRIESVGLEHFASHALIQEIRMTRMHAKRVPTTMMRKFSPVYRLVLLSGPG